MPSYTAWPQSTIELIDLQDETLAPASTANAHLKVTDSDDATWISQIDSRTVDCYAKFNLTSDMVNPLSIDDMSLTIRFECHNTFNDDILTLRMQLVQSDGATPLSDNVFVAQHDQNATGVIHEIQVPMTGLVTDPALWSGNQLWFHWNYNKSKGSDDLFISVKQVFMTGNYTADTNQNLTSEQIQQQGAITQGAIDQVRVLDGDNVSQQSQVQEGAISRNQDTVGRQLYQQNEIAPSVIAIANNLEPDHVSQQSAVQQNAMDMTHALVGENLETVGEISPIVIGQYIRVSRTVEIVGAVTEHNLVPEHVSQTSAITEGLISLERALVGENISQQSAIEQAAVVLTKHLVGENVEQRSEIAENVLHVEQLLDPEHVSQESEVSQAQIGSAGDFLAENVQQQGEIDRAAILQTQFLVPEHVSQQSGIQFSSITADHLLNIWHVSQQSAAQQAIVTTEGLYSGQHVAQRCEIDESTLTAVHILVPEHVSQRSGVEQATILSIPPELKASTVVYKHPYATLNWEHKPTAGSWQQFELLSGYVSGQGTKTVTLDGATPEEAGTFQVTLTNPAGGETVSDPATLTPA